MSRAPGEQRIRRVGAASIGDVSTPEVPQPHVAPDAPTADMVRVCDRCGTVCSADQEWCLNCGVRMTEAGQRLPGLRAAGLVVALAVLLAGGAAAASYAALRGDARSAANVPADTTGAPVAQAPATTTPVTPVTPVPSTTASTTATTTSTAKKSPVAPAAPPASSGSSGTAPATGGGSSSSGSTGSGSTGSGSTGSTGSGSTGSGGGTTSTTKTTTTTKEPSGPLVFASGQGTIYDPNGVAADKGDEGNAIDGRTGTTWKVVLADGQTGGLGYVLDFDDPTTLKTLRIATKTSGLKVKILGTTDKALPPDELDSNWDTIASERTLKSGTNAVPLKAVSGAKSKYRHVLVLFTSVPGTPATAEIREFTAVS